MGERPPETPPSGKRPEDRLDSWKEIAAYLKRDVTTVQRWEKREGMPVYRHRHDKGGSVYAFQADLDAWMQSRNLRAGLDKGGSAASPDAPATREPKSSREVNWVHILPPAGLAALLAIAAFLWFQSTEYFWRDPLAGAQFQTVSDFAGVEQAAALSADGRFVAFLSDQEGETDVWITQVGSGQFRNLTHGSFRALVNPSVRTLGFSPDGSLVTFWARQTDSTSGSEISVWAVPTLGGQPRPYLEGVAEFEWSRDGARLAYHTPGSGDPLFVSRGTPRPGGRAIYTAPTGSHAHFPVWSYDTGFIYFVQGTLPDQLDIWRITPDGATTERITRHNGRVSHPVFMGPRTLLYLATGPDGSGPWIYTMDVERRVPHRLTSGLERYSSLAASSDGRRLAATRARPKRSLWRLPVAGSAAEARAPARIPLTTGTGFSPRLGPDYVLYVSAAGTRESIWKLAGGVETELWSGQEARIFGGPAISDDGAQIAFSVRQGGQAILYAMRSDGTNVRVVSHSLELQGAPAWAPDGRSITSAALESGVPRLYRIPLDDGPPSLFFPEYSLDPAWSPDGRFVAYTGPDIGTTFSVKAATAEAEVYPFPVLTLSRGARRLVFQSDGRRLMVLRGELDHMNIWVVDIETGDERQLTTLPPDFDVRDFDISPGGDEVVLERVQEDSDVVLLDLPR